MNDARQGYVLQDDDATTTKRFDAQRIIFWVMVVTAVTAVVLAAIVGSA